MLTNSEVSNLIGHPTPENEAEADYGALREVGPVKDPPPEDPTPLLQDSRESVDSASQVAPDSVIPPLATPEASATSSATESSTTPLSPSRWYVATPFEFGNPENIINDGDRHLSGRNVVTVKLCH